MDGWMEKWSSGRKRRSKGREEEEEEEGKGEFEKKCKLYNS